MLIIMHNSDMRPEFRRMLNYISLPALCPLPFSCPETFLASSFPLATVLKPFMMARSRHRSYCIASVAEGNAKPV